MERTEIVSLYKNTPADGTVVTVCGWAKNIRDSKNIGFIALSDGGCFKTLQVVLEAGKLANYDEVVHTGLYSSLRVVGRIVLTPQAKQPFELNADSVEILGDCPADEYPLQKKKMSMEYLRTMPTLRPRTNTFNAAFRVRSVAAYAIHKFFQENGFVYAHSPLLTASDCEGAGEMFRVTTLDLDNVPKNEDGTVDYTKDFFEKPVNLTVSGQLEAEAMAMAFGKVYTFGPTFRAEKSFTTRHAAEFWMIEPEMAFYFIFVILDHRRLILINVTVVIHPVHDHQRNIAQRGVHAQLVCVMFGVDNVLAVYGDPRTGSVVPMNHHGNLVVIQRTASKAAAGRFKSCLQINACLGSERIPFSNGGQHIASDHVVDQFGHIAAAALAGVYRLAHAFQYGKHFVKGFLVAACHNRKRSGNCHGVAS